MLNINQNFTPTAICKCIPCKDDLLNTYVENMGFAIYIISSLTFVFSCIIFYRRKEMTGTEVFLFFSNYLIYCISSMLYIFISEGYYLTIFSIVNNVIFITVLGTRGYKPIMRFFKKIKITEEE